ncbi:MAG: hypothetical protein M1379_11835 [Firmicutes bacterium]|nr:hypothetical protein [Bacillota bacterium]
MNKKYLALASRIREELSELQQAVDRVRAGWDRANQTGDDFYLDSVALNLHSFYSGLEKIFELIASNVDQSKVEGENWHQALLRQMATEIETVRLPVISRESRDRLDDYRGFRHVVRNVYAFHFSPARMALLVENLPQVFDRVKTEIEAFLSFIEMQANRE